MIFLLMLDNIINPIRCFFRYCQWKITERSILIAVKQVLIVYDDLDDIVEKNSGC